MLAHAVLFETTIIFGVPSSCEFIVVAAHGKTTVASLAYFNVCDDIRVVMATCKKILLHLAQDQNNSSS